MKIFLSVKQLTYIIVAVVISTILISVSSVYTLAIAKMGIPWTDTLISSLGNVIGGVIGGLVAFIVATYQVNIALTGERNKQIEASNNLLKLIEEEIKYNKLATEQCLPYAKEKGPILKSQLSDFTWNTFIGRLVISDELLKNLSATYRLILLCKGISDEHIKDEHLTKMIEQFGRTLDAIATEFESMNLPIGLTEDKGSNQTFNI